MPTPTNNLNACSIPTNNISMPACDAGEPNFPPGAPDCNAGMGSIEHVFTFNPTENRWVQQMAESFNAGEASAGDLGAALVRAASSPYRRAIEIARQPNVSLFDSLRIATQLDLTPNLLMKIYEERMDVVRRTANAVRRLSRVEMVLNFTEPTQYFTLVNAMREHNIHVNNVLFLGRFHEMNSTRFRVDSGELMYVLGGGGDLNYNCVITEYQSMLHHHFMTDVMEYAMPWERPNSVAALERIIERPPTTVQIPERALRRRPLERIEPREPATVQYTTTEPMKKEHKKKIREKSVEVFDCDNNRVVNINLDEWCTPKQLAENMGVTKQVVNNWKERGKLNVLIIPELKLTLVQLKPNVVVS